MISILIPLFNFDVRQLVNDLTEQCNALEIDYEVLCFDDGSENRFKEMHKDLQQGRVVYKEMPKNLGRSTIRNRLADAARFPYLLFMDCDSKVVSDDYIAHYMLHLKPSTLLYGGRCYRAEAPKMDELYFHWYYGINREQSNTEQRSKNPWHSFMTNNFLIPKSIFLQVGFDESLKQYGHEDTLFGMELAKRKILIVHLDNPLEHLGLEQNSDFLKKTEQGLENLYKLWSEKSLIETKLLKVFEKMNVWRLDWLIAILFPITKDFVKKQLQSKSPSLLLFDFYKLMYLCYLKSGFKRK